MITKKMIMKEILQNERPNLHCFETARKKHKKNLMTFMKPKTKFAKNIYRIINDSSNIDEIGGKIEGSIQ